MAKIKTVPKTTAQIRAEMDAMPTASREKDRRGMRVTESGSLTRLQRGMIVEVNHAQYRVEMVNESRARCLPLNRTKKTVVFTNAKGEDCEFTPETTGGAINISPNAELPIINP